MNWLKGSAYLLLLPVLVLQQIWNDATWANWWHIGVYGTLFYAAGVLMEKGIQKARGNG